MGPATKKDKKSAPTIKEALEKASAKLTPGPASQKSHTSRNRSPAYSSPASGDEEDLEDGYDSQRSHKHPRTPRQQPATIEQFESMLNRALKETSRQITEKLTKEIRELGTRTSDLENRTDDLEAKVDQLFCEIENLREENKQLISRLEDAENHSRRSNLRIRGIPEHVVDLQSTITALFQELAPDIPIERLEIDRVHRSLTARKPNGPPRDIIVKLHYYRTKDKLSRAARAKEPLTFQGHSYQIFTDITQSTIAKRRAMKPLIPTLTHHKIRYRWGFPFALIFTYEGKEYSTKSPEELHRRLLGLSLCTGEGKPCSPNQLQTHRSPPRRRSTSPRATPPRRSSTADMTPE